MNKNINVSIYAMVKAMANAFDLISETVVGHHKKVSYISLKIGEELNLSKEKVKKLALTGLIHDLGVFYLDQKFSDLSFDSRDNRHAKVGYCLSKDLFPDKNIPKIIKYHHQQWNSGNEKEEASLLSDIIHLADRIAVLTKSEVDILSEREKINNIIQKNSKKRFWPKAVEKFINLSERKHFWLDIISRKRIENKIDLLFEETKKELILDDVYNIGILISHIIDFRSAFTATHTQGVASMAKKLAKSFGLPEKKRQTIEIAGLFHDLGKLVVPTNILNKPDELEEKEWKIMKTHTYYTYHSLDTTPQLNEIKKWGAYHHEKLNGEGYPFGLKKEDLSFEAKIMAVADIFTALSEDRPYRKGMDEEKIKNILEDMVQENALKGEIAAKIVENFQEFDQQLQTTQNKAQKEYNNFKNEIEDIIIK